VNLTVAGDSCRRWLATALTLMLAAACSGPPQEPVPEGVLIRVGDQIVTGRDFELVLAIGRVAYAHPGPESPVLGDQRRIRLLNELVEEALILEKARSLGIEVTPEQLAAAENRLRQDYPQGAFDAALLENAVDLDHWRKRLRVKLILDKTVDQVIGARVNVTPEELAALLGTQSRATPEIDSGRDRRLLEQLRRTKFEAVYPRWIRELKQEFPVQIDQAEWQRLSAERRRLSDRPGQDRPAVVPRAAKDGDG